MNNDGTSNRLPHPMASDNIFQDGLVKRLQRQSHVTDLAFHEKIYINNSVAELPPHSCQPHQTKTEKQHGGGFRDIAWYRCG